MRPEDELVMIRRLMEDGQRVIRDNGGHFLTWGVVTVIGLLITYAGMLAGAVTVVWASWAALVVAGWLISYRLGRRMAASAPTSGLAGRMLGEVWAGVGLGLTVFVFGGGLLGVIGPHAIPVAVACFIGAGCFATAVLYPSFPLRWIAFGWWAGALVMLVWPGPHEILVLAGLTVAFQVIPGLALYRRARRSSAARG